MKNDTWLDVIDDELKAYFMGFFGADGHLEDRGITTRGFMKGRRAWSIKFGLHNKDGYILKHFRDAIDPDAKIAVFVSNKYTMAPRATMSIHCWGIGDRIEEMGMARGKTKCELHIPTQIPNHLIHHFIRGYFDGDGHIRMWDRYKDGKYHGKHGVWNIVSPTITILKEMSEHLPVEISIRTVRVGENPFHILQTQSIHKIPYIKDYLYKDATIYLTRKLDAFNTFIQENSEVIEVRKNLQHRRA